MPHTRGSALFQKFFRDSVRLQTFLGNNVSTQKTDGSATLLSPNTVNASHYPFKDIPGPRPSIPFIGTAWQYFPGGRYNLSNVYEACVDKYNRYGPVVKEEFQWRKPVVHLFNPSDFETVGMLQGTCPVRPISEFVKHYRESNPHKYDTVGLANSLGDEWLRLRRTLIPVFSHLNKLEGFNHHMNSICDDFVELLRHRRDTKTLVVSNLQDLLYRLSLEAVYMLCLEARLGCLKGNLYPNSDASTMIKSVKLLFEAFQDLYYGLPLWKLYPTAAYKKLDTAESIMYDAASSRIQEVIEEMRSSRRKTDSPPGLLQTLLNMENLTDKEIRVTIIDFISGGIFTVTNAFCFLLCHIAQNPDVQEKLYQELRQLVSKTDQLGESVQELKYLRHCVRESFRLTPTIPTVTRILNKDIVASGYEVPAGTPLFCNFTVPCKHAQYFSEPDKYMPERWIDRQSNRQKVPMIMMPFGMGNRMCVGRKFAELEMHTALAKIILNYKLESTSEDVKCKQAFIIVPADPVSIVFKDREEC